MAFTSSEDWVSIRRAFVETSTRPTYAELAEQFGAPVQRITRHAADENWPLLRAKFVEAKLREANAGEVLLESIGINRAITQSAAAFGLKMFQRLSETIDKLKPDAAASSDGRNLSEISFAALNTARALKEAGIIGLPKELADAGKLGNGQWNPQLLIAINSTIQNLVAQTGLDEKAAASSLASETPAPAELPAPDSRPVLELSSSPIADHVAPLAMPVDGERASTG